MDNHKVVIAVAVYTFILPHVIDYWDNNIIKMILDYLYFIYYEYRLQ